LLIIHCHVYVRYKSKVYSNSNKFVLAFFWFEYVY